MRSVLVLTLLVGLVYCSSSNKIIRPPYENQRLISFNETSSAWMSEKEVERLTINRINFIDITDYQHHNEQVAPTADPLPNQPIHKLLVLEVIKGLSATNLRENLEHLVTYTTRAYKTDTGAAAANWIYQQMNATAAGRDDITVELFTHTWAQPSVIATIQGNGPNKDEIVIIGGHEDSVSSGARAPGADDDASGTVSVMEVFRVIVNANYKNDRTLQFITYAAEEAGLLGSQAIASKYVSQQKQVHAVLQLDMTGYGSIESSVGVTTDYVDLGLTSYVKLLIDAYTVLTWVDTKCGYGCSDHASWNRNGYRASFVFETDFSKSNPYIHTSSDLITHLNFPKMLEFTKLAVGFAIELGDVTAETFLKKNIKLVPN